MLKYYNSFSELSEDIHLQIFVSFDLSKSNNLIFKAKMPNQLLKNKKGIIFGALDENSIAWKTAEKVHEQGGSFVLTNAPVAVRMGSIDLLAKKTNSIVVPADATSNSDLDNLINETMKHFNGKIDFVLHSIGMSINVRNGKHYTDLNHDWLTK